MRITKKNKLYQITFMPTLFPVNCYLVEEDDGLTLIDAAVPFSVQGILRAAKEIGKPIQKILLTHAHSDHYGALDGLKKVLTDVPVYIAQREAALLAGSRSLEPGEPETPIKGGVPKTGQIKSKPDVLLKDGDRVGSLLVISSPGHTPGSISFFDTRDASLIVGDAFQVRGGVAVSGQVKPFFPFPAWATWSKQMALESARRLRSFNPSILAVGHGNLAENPTAIMDDAIIEAAKRLE